MRAVIFGVVYLSSTKLKKSTMLSGKHHISYPTNEESLSYIFFLGQLIGSNQAKMYSELSSSVAPLVSFLCSVLLIKNKCLYRWI